MEACGIDVFKTARATVLKSIRKEKRMGDGITLRWFSWSEETDIGLCFYGECVIEGGNYDGGQEVVIFGKSS